MNNVHITSITVLADTAVLYLTCFQVTFHFHDVRTPNWFHLTKHHFCV